MSTLSIRDKKQDVLQGECKSLMVREHQRGKFDTDAGRGSARLARASKSISFLESELRDARCFPLRQLKNLTLFHVLRFLAKASPPLSKRRAKRFRRSAEKRDPNRKSLPETFIKFLVRYPETLVAPPEDFDPDWYAMTYPDVADSFHDPLEHFMDYGHAEGRRANGLHRSKDVSDARLDTLKEPQLSDELALFVTFAPGGKIKPHVPPYLSALKQAGLSIILVVAADNPDAVETADLIDKVDGLFVRQNGGFDFAAWAHVVREIEISGVRSILLVNDSLVGPFTIEGMNDILARARGSDVDLVGLTNSVELKQHLQSYFLVAKKKGVKTLLEFLGTVRILEDKWQVIFSYEIQISDFFRNRGLQTEALFPSFVDTNPTVHQWRQLIDQGFPFVKMEVIRNSKMKGWRSLLRSKGYNVAVAEKSVDLINNHSAIETNSNKAAGNR